MPRPRAFVAILAVLVAGLAGCSKDSKAADTSGLPDGATLAAAAASAMGDVTSAHITLELTDGVSNLPLRRAEGDMTRSNGDKGSIQLEQSGALIEYEFVLLGASIHLKGVSGGWQTLPAQAAATIYDPSVVLNQSRGLAHLLATVSNATTKGTETIGGTSTYRVSVMFENVAAANLVPGISGSIAGDLWLDATTKQLRRAILTASGSVGGKGSATMNLTDINKPVQISDPS